MYNIYTYRSNTYRADDPHMRVTSLEYHIHSFFSHLSWFLVLNAVNITSH